MEHDPEDGYVTVEVPLSAAMAAELDSYAVSHGYKTVDAVVAEAIEQHS